VDTVAGYTTYIDLIQPLIQDKHIISTPMMKEVERVQAAIDTARNGRSCALVSSGDPGIYAMAGLVFELCRQQDIRVCRPDEALSAGNDTSALPIEIVPGIPALAAGAALLGAPLTHDFAVISLSDLLTRWELIEKRLNAAAEADFVMVLYNPKSRRRSDQLAKACRIIMAHRPARTPVGVVTGAMRENQKIEMMSLADLPAAEVGMQTIVFIGSSASARYLDFMFTPRGYAGKYKMEKQ
jgi:precorrin-3B C17-methyltransferase